MGTPTAFTEERSEHNLWVANVKADGSSELIHFPRNLSVTVHVDNQPAAGHFVAVSRVDFYANLTRVYLIDTDDFGFSAGRDEYMEVWVGWDDPAASESMDISYTIETGLVIDTPGVDVDTNGGAIELTVDHGENADTLDINMYSGCSFDSDWRDDLEISD